MKIKLTAYLTAILTIVQLAVILLSWVLSATTTLAVRSLLSPEGIRWLLGHFNDIILSPVLVWLLLMSIAYGTFKYCRFSLRSTNYRERMGRNAALFVFALLTVVILLLGVVPHAILLSASGSIFPSPFSKALLPMLSLVIIICSIVYGLMARTFPSFTSIVEACLKGISQGAPLLLIYILFIQCYESLCYIIL